MLISADATLEFPRDLVFRAYRDRLTQCVEYMPNIRRIEVASRKDAAGTVELINVWHGGVEVPAPARVVLSESMLSWTDYATWRESDYTCDWRLQTHSFKDAVDCRGTNRFVEVDGGTRLEIRGQLEVDASKIKAVPKLLSKSVSKTVAEFLIKKITPNLVEVTDGLRRYLEKTHKA